MVSKPFQNILVAEDNDAERHLIHMSITELNGAAAIADVANGADCLAYVRRQGEYAEAVRPDLIVLDNMMPGMTGAQVLEALNRDADLSRISVLYWSSGSNRDVRSALRSRGCAQKPMTLDDYRSAFESVCEVLSPFR